MRKITAVLLLCMFLWTCIEPFEAETQSFQEALVVEATITDELKTQQVFLSRTSDLRYIADTVGQRYNPNVPFRPIVDTATVFARGATVKIVDGEGIEFDFREEEPGTYESEVEFAAEAGKQYQLRIVTAENVSFESNFMEISGKSQIDDVYAERTVNDQGTEGMAIYVDGSDRTGEVDRYRFTYEETYKIIAPNWTPREFNILSDGTVPGEVPVVETMQRSQEEQVCFNTVNSEAIRLASTANSETGTLRGNLVRFIDRNDPALSHRYSILVKQHLQSFETYRYYENLRNFSSSESVFSEIQPGFLDGNINALDDRETVIGFFDVASVDQKRLFFNYVDFFPGEALPPYFFSFNCDRLLSPCLGDPARDGDCTQNCPQGLIPRLKLELVEYLGENGSPEPCEGPYYVTPRLCGDCTVIGSNVVPDFWIE